MNAPLFGVRAPDYFLAQSFYGTLFVGESTPHPEMWAAGRTPTPVLLWTLSLAGHCLGLCAGRQALGGVGALTATPGDKMTPERVCKSADQVGKSQGTESRWRGGRGRGRTWPADSGLDTHTKRPESVRRKPARHWGRSRDPCRARPAATRPGDTVQHPVALPPPPPPGPSPMRLLPLLGECPAPRPHGG